MHTSGLGRRWRAAYVGGEPVGRCGLVDVVLVVIGVGAALRGLPFPPTHGAALHHAAAQLGRRLLRGVVGVAVLRHHTESRGGRSFSAAPSHGHLNVPERQCRCLPSAPEVPPGSVQASARAAPLVASVTGNQVLWGQLRSHVTHRLDGDPV